MTEIAPALVEQLDEISANPNPTPSEASDQYSKLIDYDVSTEMDADRKKMVLNDTVKANTLSGMIEHADDLEDVMNAVEVVYGSDDPDLKAIQDNVVGEYFEKGLEALKAEKKAKAEKSQQLLPDRMKGALQSEVDSSQARDIVDRYAEAHNGQLESAALAEAALSGVQINHPDAIKIDKAA